MRNKLEDSNDVGTIAIVGMSGRFPGAPNLEVFWERLRDGVVDIGEIPSDRWDWRQCWGDPQSTPDVTNSRWGGFIEGVRQFDREFFAMSAREAESLDPQQRLALELAWHCLEDAGMRPSSLPNRRVGVFAGLANLDYKELVEAAGLPVDAYYATGIAASALANRLSYFFDFHGPSLTVDTACSASLHALHLAKKALKAGECDMALAGGVSLLLTPRRYVGFARARMLSPTGTVRTFDDDADGLVRGEGGGFVLLKPLRRAEEDGDRIHGLLLGSALNHSGKTYSLTYPSTSAQAEVISSALKDAGVTPEAVSYVEAHGTGTPKGDPIELEGILAAYGAGRLHPCLIGSVKPNVGHLEAAAGMAGVLKVLLAMKYRQIPPLVHFRALNHRVDGTRVRDAGLDIASTLQQWTPPSPETALVAGISAFGFAGTNAHVVLAQAPMSAAMAHAVTVSEAPAVLCLSARTPSALARQRERLAAWMDEHADSTTLASLCHALSARREHFVARCAIVGSDFRAVRDSLAKASDVPGASYYSGLVPTDEKGNPQWLVAGQEEIPPSADAFARAYVRGLPPETWSAHRGRAPFIPLPLYSFEPIECWLPELVPDPVGEPPSPVKDRPLVAYEEVWVPEERESIRAPGEIVLRCVGAGGRTILRFDRIMDADRDVLVISERIERWIRSRPAGGHDEDGLRALLDAAADEGDGDTLWYWGSPGSTGPGMFDEVLALTKAIIATRWNLRRVILLGRQGDLAAECWPVLTHMLERHRPGTAYHVLLVGANVPTEKIVGCLIDESFAKTGGAVRYVGDERQRRRIVAAPLARPTDTLFRQGGRYVITGGGGAIGRILARHLRKAYGASVVLLGRREHDATIDAAVAALNREPGTGVLSYHCLDVTDEVAVRAWVANDSNAIHGVFHLAGIQDERSIQEKSADDIRAGLAAKLAVATSLRPLCDQASDFVCHFSSLAAYVGDRGGATYALGNRLLDRFVAAHPRNVRGAPQFAIGWPVWRDGGMDIADPVERDRYLASSGQRLIESDEAMHALESIVSGSRHSVLLMAGDGGAMRTWLDASTRYAAEVVAPLIGARDDVGAPPHCRLPIAAIREAASAVLKIPADALDEHANLADLGFDSIGIMDFAQALSVLSARLITPTALFNHPTLTRVAELVSPLADADIHLDRQSAGTTASAPIVALAECGVPYEAVAVIGMSGRFPGARDVDAFWDLLIEGRSAIGPAPMERFAEPFEPGVPAWLAALPGVDEFDDGFFDVPPVEAERMDPRERLLLQEAWRALEDANLGGVELRRQSVGMFVGVENGEYGEGAGERRSIVSDHNGVLAARLSYVLDLSGPNMALNTACSSGLVALHQACRSLQAGDCGIAIAAAVNLMLSPVLYSRLARAGMLSSEGTCRALDDRADGIVPGDAVVALVLKPLTAALADGDPVHAVIRGSGVNYDGRSNGITAPNGAAQTALIRRVMRDAAITPDDLGYVVMHGTGTRLGDPVEIDALGEALGAGRPGMRCAITSNKPNVGHTFAASGLVNMVNMVMAMRRGMIPPQAGFASRNIFAHWRDDRFHVNERPCAWPDGARRIGAVSAFGMSGTNAHVILESFEPPSTLSVAPALPSLLLLSAKSKAALGERLRQLADYLERCGTDVVLADVARALAAGRLHFDVRIALVADDLPDAVRQLRASASIGVVPVANAPRVSLPELEARALALRDACRRSRESVGADVLRLMLAELGRFYLEGASAETLTIEPSAGRQRLPTYPFERHARWMASRVSDGRRERHRVATGIRRDGSDGFAVWLSSSDPRLCDHRILGGPVLSGAAFLELICAAAEAEGNGLPLRIADVSWQAAAHATADGLGLRVAFTAENDMWRFTVNDAVSNAGQTHATGIVGAALPLPRDPVDIGALIDRASRAYSADELYRRFTKLGIDYGPSHRRLEEIYAGDDFVVAKLGTNGDQAREGTVDAGLLDAAFQAALVLTDSGPGHRPAVPFMLEEMHLRRPIRGNAWAVVRRTGASSSVAHLVDVELTDASGESMATLTGLASMAWRGVEQGRVATRLHKWTWRPAAVHEEDATTRRRHVFLSPVFGDMLACVPEGAGLHCDMLAHAPDNGRAGGGGLSAHIDHVIGVLNEHRHVPLLVQLVCPGERAEDIRAIMGILLTAELEQANIRVQLVLVDPVEPAAQRWSNVIGEYGADKRVRHVGGRREVLVAEPMSSASVGPCIRADGCYAIVGGAGGIGSHVARHILASGPFTRVVLLGRNDPGQDWLTRIGSLDRIEFRQLDVTDAKAVSGWVKETTQRGIQLKGIVHAAGVLHDQFLIAMKRGDARGVLAPKVDGLACLDTCTAHLPLDWFVVFSSLSGAFGNPGQGAYAAANAYMDAYMEARARRVSEGSAQGRSLSIQWPLWADGGMRMPTASVHAMEQATGLVPLPESAALETIEIALSGTEQVVMVTHGDTSRIDRWLASASRSHDAPGAVAANDSRDGDGLRIRVVKKLRRLLAETLKCAESHMDPDERFETYGIDSLLIVEINERLEREFGKLPKTLFFEYSTLSSLATYFADRHASAFGDSATGTDGHIERRQHLADGAPRQHESQATHDEPIAIVGLAGRFPGARDMQSFWTLLSEGRDGITDIPADRWDVNAAFFDPIKGKPGRSYSRWGGFIEGMDEFDPLFFQIAPSDAERMDPQERLFLQCAYGAIEDAGYTPASLGRGEGEGSNVGVFAGVMYQEYQLHGVEQTALGRPLTLAGTSASVANRVSYHLDLRGPSMAVDTMCSSSLTAIDLACHSLRRGECEAALAGGVNLSLHRNKYLLLSEQRFVSSKGRCESFGEGGDGYVPAEGVGVVVLKRLSAARTDGDHIYGVIASSAINHGGRNQGYTVPNPARQADVVQQALRRSGIDPADVSYIEAHGTGTSLGDPIEIQGLSSVYTRSDDDGVPLRRCAIGSVKSNIGHAESAAGIAGLAKVLLQIQHGMLVPSLHANITNAAIDFDDTRFVVQTSLEPWPRPRRLVNGQMLETGRIAGISSFGAGGGNAHLMVREWIDDRLESGAGHRLAGAIVLSARDDARLRERAEDMVRALHVAADTLLLHRVAYTLQVGRMPMDHRMAFTAASVADATEQLRAFLGDSASHFRGFHGVRDRGAGMGPSKETLARWIDEGRIDDVLRAWCGGASVTWDDFHPPGARPRRLSLPTYPFERKRYWLPASSPAKSVDNGHATWTLRPDDAALLEHVLHGRPLVAGMAYPVLLKERLASHGSLADGRMLLRDIRWRQPCVVADEAIELALNWQRTEQGIAFKFTTRRDGTTTIHCEGLVDLEAHAGEPEQHDVVAVEAIADMRLPGDECYAAFEARGMRYGTSHRTLVELARASETVVGRLRSLTPVSASGLSTALLDGALQALLGFHDGAGETMGVPVHLEQMIIHSACKRVMTVVARRRGTHRFDIALCDVQGRSCVSLKGFMSQSLPINAGGSAVDVANNSAHSGNWLLAPVWQPASLPQNTDAWSGRVLVIAGAPAQLRLDERFVVVSADMAVIRTALGSTPSFDAVVFVHEATTSLDISSLSQRCESVVSSMFSLVRELVARDYRSRALRLVVAGAYSTEGDVSDPVLAALHGMVGVIARDIPAWRVTSLAADSRDAWDPAIWFGLPAGAEKGPWRQRAGQWMRRALAPRAGSFEPQSTFRRHGTYVIVGGAGGVGRALTGHLTMLFDARVIWIGRRAQNDAVLEALASMDVFGRRPEYIQADATNAEALRRALDSIEASGGSIHGVVHSALVLGDANIASMTEADFSRVLAAKVHTSVALVQAIGDRQLDFLLFFSSFASFAHGLGQANYAAGSAFQDAFANAWAKEGAAYPVKVINWGFWGSTGIVATPAHRQRMASVGIGSVEPPAAMRALDALIQGPDRQLAFINLTSMAPIEALLGTTTDEGRVERPSSHPALSGGLAQAWRNSALAAGGLGREEWNPLLLSLLALALESGGTAAPSAADRLHRWREQSLRYLSATPPVASVDAAAAWARWERMAGLYPAGSSIRAQYDLVDASMRALPAVLNGTRRATDVIFPRGSFGLVEGIYGANPVSDYFNRALASRLCLLAETLGRPLRLLEVGAGTGGTTLHVIDELGKSGIGIAEYCFTDISAAFLEAARERFKGLDGAFRFVRFDVSQDPAAQGLPGDYDAVIATNVLHATSDVRAALRHCRRLVADGGLLLANEISAPSLFAHLTFGILDGWWEYTDEALRVAGSPVLDSDTWEATCLMEGWGAVTFPLRDDHHLGQQLLVAQALTQDGQPHRSDENRQRLMLRLRELLAEVLKVPAAGIPASEPFSEFGLDSILAMTWMDAIARELAIDADVTMVFEHDTLDRLAAHLSSRAPVTTPTPMMRHATDAMLSIIRSTLADVLKVEPGQVGADDPFADMGMESISGAIFTSRLADVLGVEVAETAIYEFPTSRLLAEYLRERAPSSVHPVAENIAAAFAVSASTSIAEESGRHTHEDIRERDVAIIGLSFEVPGAHDLDALWNRLVEGAPTTSRVDSRWIRERGEISTSVDSHNGGSDRFGGFLSSVDRFDAGFFGLSPNEAESMDPQQRRLLTHTWLALQDAAVDDGGRGHSIGVFVAAGNNEYAPTGMQEEDPYAMTSGAPCMIANRISFLLDLHGPSELTDTACSSTLVALHRAVHSLALGECGQAVVAAVNFLLDSAKFDGFDRLGFLSRDGLTRSFDAAADGFVRSEAVGAIVLKPLRAALRDGDTIRAVIKGTAVHHGGRGATLTAPNAAGIRKVATEALGRAGLSATDVGYIEAHGVASPVGDAIELNALRDAYASIETSDPPCYLGTAKPIFGHAELASGLVAICKAISLFGHRQIPAMPLFASLNRNAVLNGRWRVASAADAWGHRDGLEQYSPRRIAINSFGFGGVNAHVILEEPPSRPMDAFDQPTLMAVSGRDATQLSETLSVLGRCFMQPDPPPTADVARTLCSGRRAEAWRIAFVVDGRDQLAAAFEASAKAVTAITRLDAGGMLVVERDGRRFHIGRVDREQTERFSDIDTGTVSYETIAIRWCSGDDAAVAVLSVRGRKLGLPAPVLAERRQWRGEYAPSRQSAPASAVQQGTTESIVRTVLSQLLGHPADGFDSDTMFTEYGLDSMMDRQLAHALSDALDVRLTGADVFTHPSIRAMCAYVDAQSGPVVPVRIGVPDPTPTGSSTADDPLADLIARLQSGEVDIDEALNFLGNTQ